MNTRGVIMLLPVLLVALVAWTAGWLLGQKRVCDQVGGCVWKTGTTSAK